MDQSNFGEILLYVVALLFSVVFHECAHGWVADKNGDPTARMMGRLTLNPIPHLDPFGSILLPALFLLSGSSFFFAYAKPVPVDVSQLNNPRVDGIKVALAGPGSNLLLGTLCAVAYGASAAFLGMEHALSQLFIIGMRVNVMLAIFNLIPVPPLDGSWLLDHTLRGNAYNTYRMLKPYGMFLLIGILLLPPVSYVLIRWPSGILIGWLLQVSQAVAGMVS